MPDDSRHRLAPDPRPGHSTESDAAPIRLRPLAAVEEYLACVALQIETWGEQSADIVPASVMQVASRIGGLAVGAFAEDGSLMGFVFGLTGLRDGELAHWSHMLAVQRDARGSGIGRRLKEYQRAELARRGIGQLYWTFDPLQARNAHLNLNRLGVRVLEYVVNMYGSSASPLHHGLATDRLIVWCSTAAPPVEPTSSSMPAGPLPILTPFPRPGDVLHGETATAAAVLIEVPGDLEEVASRSPAAAAEWRAATRKHFQWALRHGFAVTGLRRDPVATRAFYVVAREST